jgi:putative peptide zinc metalloprotease protein
MLVIHECGHLRCMKQYGLKTRGIYLIPLLGAAAVAEDAFPSRRAEATIALAGPLTGAVLAAGTGWCTSPPATGSSPLPPRGWR